MSDDPVVPVIRNAHVKAWPAHEAGGKAVYMPLSTALTTRFDYDAHFTAYSVPSVSRRLATDAVFEKLTDGVPMVLAMFDVDGPGHGATDEWWFGELEKIERLQGEHRGVLAYRTRGGYRVVGKLPEPFVLRTPDDKDVWSLTYVRWCASLLRRFKIEADISCKDWTRLYRLPHATRESK